MINEPRLKTEPLKKSLLSDGHFTIDKCWFQDGDFGFYMVYTTVVLNAS